MSLHNFCDNCKVSIDNHISNCPLCGKCVSEKEKNLLTTQTTTYPSVSNLNNKKMAIIKLISCSLFLATAVLFAIEFFVTKSIRLSFYFLASYLLFQFAVLIPIKHNFSLATSSILALLFLQCYILFIELYSHTFGWGVTYVMPLIALAYSIYNGVLIVAKGYFNFEYFLPICFSGAISIVFFLVNYLNSWKFWPSLAAMLFSCVIVLLIIFFKNKRLKKSIEKKFHF